MCMHLLIFSQTLFYLVASFAIIVIGALCVMITYHLVRIMRHLQNISDSLDDTTSELKARIKEVLEKLSSLPLLSYFLRSESKRVPRSKKRS